MIRAGAVALCVLLLVVVTGTTAWSPADAGSTVMQASSVGSSPGATILSTNSVATHAHSCGCAPSCFPSSCACPNTCGCCPLTHVTPEIKPEPNACNCCHLDKCGCCVKKMIAPALKNAHVAPELKAEPRCPFPPCKK